MKLFELFDTLSDDTASLLDLLLSDDQSGGESQRVVVSGLGEKTKLHQDVG